ncbi:MAG: DUF2848 domain-containing protein [Betaproteobacteria bacterium]
MSSLCFDIGDAGNIEVVPALLVIAGWTGRDRVAIEHHIEELARLGVRRPSSVPLYYRASRSLLTQAEDVEMLGAASSGEVEPVLVRHDGRWWLTVGSDHTDRSVETYSVAVSKQMCAKPVARVAWAWDEVAERADGLVLHSEIFEAGRWVTYQEGPLARIRPLPALVDSLPAEVSVTEGLVLFCGTHGAIPDAAGVGIRPALRMRLALIDAVASRHILHEYRVTTLPQIA